MMTNQIGVTRTARRVSSSKHRMTRLDREEAEHHPGGDDTAGHLVGGLGVQLGVLLPVDDVAHDDQCPDEQEQH